MLQTSPSLEDRRNQSLITMIITCRTSDSSVKGLEGLMVIDQYHHLTLTLEAIFYMGASDIWCEVCRLQHASLYCLVQIIFNSPETLPNMEIVLYLSCDFFPCMEFLMFVKEWFLMLLFLWAFKGGFCTY